MPRRLTPLSSSLNGDLRTAEKRYKITIDNLYTYCILTFTAQLLSRQDVAAMQRFKRRIRRDESVGYSDWRTVPRWCRALADLREHRVAFLMRRRIPDASPGFSEPD